jgi:hypothetical protein
LQDAGNVSSKIKVHLIDNHSSVQLHNAQSFVKGEKQQGRMRALNTRITILVLEGTQNAPAVGLGFRVWGFR